MIQNDFPQGRLPSPRLSSKVLQCPPKLGPLIIIIYNIIIHLKNVRIVHACVDVVHVATSTGSSRCIIL